MRKLRNIIKDHDYKIKEIKGIVKENTKRKEGTCSGREGQRNRAGGSSLGLCETDQPKEMPITQRLWTVEGNREHRKGVNPGSYGTETEGIDWFRGIKIWEH